MATSTLTERLNVKCDDANELNVYLHMLALVSAGQRERDVMYSVPSHIPKRKLRVS